MASDQELTKEVAESRVESGEAGDARVTQGSRVKSEAQKEKEEQQALDRRSYSTPSSESLPRVDFSSEAIAKSSAVVGDKAATGQDKSGDRVADRDGDSKKGGGAKPSELGPKLAESERRLFPVDSNGRDYHGEGLSRNVTPGTHEVAKGESLKQIAKDHLGPDATEDDVKKYTTEIEKINHLDQGQVQEGQMLNLPGHTNGG